MSLRPYNNTIFLDSDTFCIDPKRDIDSLFDILKSFDIAAGHDWAADRDEFINGFPQFIIGILMYQMNDYVKYMFKQWLYKQYFHTSWQRRDRFGRVINNGRDQDAFHHLMTKNAETDPYLQAVRIYVYPPEISCELGSENTTHYQFGPMNGVTGYKLPTVKKCRFIHSHFINPHKLQF
eukprot:258689_1